MRFTTAGDVYTAAAAPGAGLGTARIRFAVHDIAPGALQWIAGVSTGSDGWLLCLDNTLTATKNQLTFYLYLDGTLRVIGRKFFMPTDVGKRFTAHMTFDGIKGKAYLDGRELKGFYEGTSQAVSTSPLSVGSRTDGSFTGNVSLYEVAFGTTALTRSQVYADVAAGIGGALSGETAHYVAASDTADPWVDTVGSADLTKAGTPAITYGGSAGNYRGCVEVWGDSIALGRISGGSSADGWRRAVQLAASAAGVPFTFAGFGASVAPSLDWDYFVSATGGEGIHDRLPSLATDIQRSAPDDSVTILTYVINDIINLNRTAAQVRTDIASAVAIINAQRPGRPILITDCLPVATASATSPQHAEILDYQTNFASQITTLQGTYPNVHGCVVSGVITDANDTAQLYDGVHPTPATYAQLAGVIGPALISILTADTSAASNDVEDQVGYGLYANRGAYTPPRLYFCSDVPYPRLATGSEWKQIVGGVICSETPDVTGFTSINLDTTTWTGTKGVWAVDAGDLASVGSPVIRGYRRAATSYVEAGVRIKGRTSGGSSPPTSVYPSVGVQVRSSGGAYVSASLGLWNGEASKSLIVTSWTNSLSRSGFTVYGAGPDVQFVRLEQSGADILVKTSTNATDWLTVATVSTFTMANAGPMTSPEGARVSAEFFHYKDA